MNPEVILVRLNKESPKKCSLTPLFDQGRTNIQWHRVSIGQQVVVGEATLLHPDGEPLSPEDAGRPLLLIDSSWRDLPRVLGGVEGLLHYRSLPEGFRTAYPRRSKAGTDPTDGLASIEALHAAQALLGLRDDSLLEGYHWKDDWLDSNSDLLTVQE